MIKYINSLLKNSESPYESEARHITCLDPVMTDDASIYSNQLNPQDIVIAYISVRDVITTLFTVDQTIYEKYIIIRNT